VLAQSKASLPTIGIVAPFSAPQEGDPSKSALHDTLASFHQGLIDLGHVEGKTIRIEYRWAGHRADRLPALAAELVDMNVDVIVTVSMLGVRAARKTTDSIPIVSAGAGDLVRGGLIASLARPGGNITGLTTINPELDGKTLELLKSLLPGISRVALLYYERADRKTTALHRKDAEPAARALGLELQAVALHSPDEIAEKFSEMKRDGIDAVLALVSAFTLRNRAQIAEVAAASRLPTVYQAREFTQAGGLMSYGANRIDQWRRAAGYVDQILKGAKPADLAVQRPTRFELVINMKSAKALGITIPPSIMLRADRVIE